MHRHQLQRVLALARLVLAGFQRGVGEEGGERVDRLAGLGARVPPAMKAAAALTSSSRFSIRSAPSRSVL